MSKIFTLATLGLEVEIGKFARQADGSVWLKHGNNVVLSSAVATPEEREFMGFFPLTVEYRERTSAVGKFPGGFIKREGRLSDKEVLTSRMIDRPIRPLFPKYYFNEVQVIATVFSSDNKFPNDVLGIIGSSLALTLSNIPFLGPVGAVKVGRVNGEWKFNLGFEEKKESNVELLVAGTKNGVCMVEGYCDSLSEEELVEALFLAHDQIKEQIDWQLSIQKELAVGKVESASEQDWTLLEEKIKAYVKKEFCLELFKETKEEQNKVMRKLKKDLLEYFAHEIETGAVSKAKVLFLFDGLLKEMLPDLIAEKQHRIDGRGFTQVRPIEAEVGLLPCVHGSSLFQRGETQALASVTLGTAQDAQKGEDLTGSFERTFMLHYNFPPFSTGEVRPIRGVGRREIGHGYLAERSFLNVLPSQEEFPYTIRSVADILESNGSSSMASVCSTTLAMMDAGIPIKEMVGGVAMGLMKDSSGKFHILTDILGIEDALGLMDFKVTGTEKGIMAVQMDIKAKAGLTREILSKALSQALEGRLHILGEMKKVMTKPRAEVSDLAPRVTSFKVAVDKIGAVIGPAGKNIKEIVAVTGADINIEDDGTVRIYATESASAKKAEGWVKALVGDIEPGTMFDGILRRIAEFGLFVELVPGKDGLVHISKISKENQARVGREINEGDVIKVKVISVEQDTGRIRLEAPELQ